MLVLDRRPALHPAHVQRTHIGDVVAAGGAAVVRQRHARRGRVDVSRVKAKEVGSKMLPARSVWPARSTVLRALRQLGEGGGAGAPVSCRRRASNSTVAPLSMPRQRSARGSLVVLSVPEEPVSLASATTGAAGAVTSIVTLRGSSPHSASDTVGRRRRSGSERLLLRFRC